MKKSGILNAQLLCELTKLRHQDKLVVCDAGFPIPAGANVTDVSLVAGLPDFRQVLRAVVTEMIFEKYVIFDAMKEKNPEYHQLVTGLFVNQASQEVKMAEFLALAQDVKLFIRTGELRPASNIMLTSASGVEAASKKFDVTLP